MINKIIKILIEADFLFMSASGLIMPVFAIFVVDNIGGGSAQVVGTAVAIYWITKSILRIPIAYCLDKSEGESDDFYVMVIGFLIYSITYFLYILASTPMHIYAIQLLNGIGGAMAFPPWYGFFTRHIDKRYESTEWSLQNAWVGIGVAGAGYAGGVIADNYGFTSLFITGGILCLFGTFLLLSLKKKIV